MKALSLFAASVFAATLALTSGALAAEDMGSQSMGSEQMESQASGSQSQAGSMAATDPQQIRQVQEKLKEKGYNTGKVDGKMGPRTAKALRNFQRDQGIETSGQIDQQTLQALGVSGQGAQEQYGVSPEFESGQEQQTPAAPSESQPSGMEEQQEPSGSEQMQEDTSGASGGGTSGGMSR